MTYSGFKSANRTKALEHTNSHACARKWKTEASLRNRVTSFNISLLNHIQKYILYGRRLYLLNIYSSSCLWACEPLAHAPLTAHTQTQALIKRTSKGNNKNRQKTKNKRKNKKTKIFLDTQNLHRYSCNTVSTCWLLPNKTDGRTSQWKARIPAGTVVVGD